ncbi:MAG: tetratricopeptide repeat protein, partial [Chitinispirillaceae bacterium]
MRSVQNTYRSAMRFPMLCLLSLGCIISSAHALTPNGGYSAPYFQADYIQDISDFTSAMINPALTYRVDQFYLGGGLYRWDLDLDDNLGYQQFSFLTPIRLNQTAGLTVIGTGSSIDQMEVGQGGSGLVPGDILRYGDIWFVGHYGVRLLPWFMIGANPKVLRQNQFNSDSRWGFGLDVGAYFNPLDHYRFGDLGVSISLQDIVPAMLEWDTESGTERQQTTTRMRAGLRYAWLNDRLIANCEFVLDNAFVDMWKSRIDEGEFDDLTDGSILKKVPRFSAHFKMEFIPQVWVKCGWANNNIPYAGFNLNLIYPLPEMINYVNFDAHIGYSINETERGLTMMVKLGTDFGPTREQRESKRLYDRLILAPMNAYNEAMRLYLAGKYWEASFAFGKVLSLFPNFHLNDMATLYLGNCYRFLDMNDIAREIYKEGLAEYTTSDVRPKMLYGIQNLDYREGKFEDALKNHAFITNLYPESEIIPDADYLAGEIHFQRKNYNAAEQFLGRIKPDAPTYLYAQYTLSIINIENDKTNAAVRNLTNIVKDTTTDQAELLLLDAANNKLGQLYFEQVELRKAVEAFSNVPEGSPYGDEALLGVAWSWIKVNR